MIDVKQYIAEKKEQNQKGLNKLNKARKQLVNFITIATGNNPDWENVCDNLIKSAINDAFESTIYDIYSDECDLHEINTTIDSPLGIIDSPTTNDGSFYHTPFYLAVGNNNVLRNLISNYNCIRYSLNNRMNIATGYTIATNAMMDALIDTLNKNDDVNATYNKDDQHIKIIINCD